MYITITDHNTNMPKKTITYVNIFNIKVFYEMYDPDNDYAFDHTRIILIDNKILTSSDTAEEIISKIERSLKCS